LREDFGIADQVQALVDTLPRTETHLVPSVPEQGFAEVIVHETTSCVNEIYEVHEAGGICETHVQSRQSLEQSQPQHGQIRIEAEGLKFTADSSYPTSQLAELLRGLVMS
jgi:hypothetical protein